MTIKNQQGFLAIAAVLIIAVFGFIGIMATYLLNNSLLGTTNNLNSAQAFYIAESGLETAAHSLLNSTFASRLSCAGLNGATILTDYTFTGAAGPYTVTSTGPTSPVTTLNGALTAAATTIPVASTAGYPTYGRFMIDRESINYSGISGNSFINATRGVDGTTATTHVSGAALGQYQCNLTSTGGVSSLALGVSSIGGKRTLQESVELPEGWSVGTLTAGASAAIHWNKPTELAWTTSNIAGTGQTMNAVNMLSNSDVWAVGNATAIQHWNGTAWAASSTVGIPSRNLFGIYCTASNNCWAVGATTAFLLWNGSTWTLQTATVSTLPNSQYNSVFCNTANDCWAVANNTAGGDVFAHWDGTNWTRDASRPTPQAVLSGVTCNSTSDCWAVGANRTFVHWNGTAWSEVTVTVPNVAYASVDCTATNNCWAVGAANGGSSVIVQWNGTTWSRFTPVSVNVALKAVTCHTASDCWAVGASATTLHWDGTSWTAIANPLAAGITLNGVDMVGPFSFPLSAWQEIYP